jgi:hypothetical protein
VKRIILGAMLFLNVTALSAQAAEPALERPHWSLELKGGVFIPDIDNWATYYGRRDISEYGGSLAYKITPQIEVGLEGSYIKDKGRGFAPGHGIVTGDVTYELAPLNVFVLVRGVFRDNQVLIPYAGGGWTRMYYREKVQYQGDIKGSTDGYHARAGLQLVLDSMDPQQHVQGLRCVPHFPLPRGPVHPRYDHGPERDVSKPRGNKLARRTAVRVLNRFKSFKSFPQPDVGASQRGRGEDVF